MIDAAVYLLTDEAQRGRRRDATHHIAAVPVEVAQWVHSQGQACQGRQYPERRRVTADMMVQQSSARCENAGQTLQPV